MKLNNRGFGMKETLIYLCLLLLVLLVASCSVSTFYDNLEVSKNEDYVDSYLFDVDDDIEENVDSVIDDSNDEMEIDYEHYYDEEKRFEFAVMDYLDDHYLDENSTIYLDELVESGYMKRKIVDSIDGKSCSGYANVSVSDSGYQVEPYILCSNYETEGYR